LRERNKVGTRIRNLERIELEKDRVKAKDQISDLNQSIRNRRWSKRPNTISESKGRTMRMGNRIAGRWVVE
jgi:hypothetical protein